MPRGTLFVAYSLIVSWAVLMFRFRRGESHLHHAMVSARCVSLVSVALLAAQIMLFIVPVQGVLQAAVNWWFANNLLFLWFGSIGLGTAYYMIPKVIGRPVYSYHLAAIGFWTYAFFASWTGMQRLVDGPFPAWMITASIAAMILYDHPSRDGWTESSHDHARLFSADALQPDAAFHRFWRDVLYRRLACSASSFRCVPWRVTCNSARPAWLIRTWVSTPFSR